MARKGLDKIFSEAGIKCHATGAGSLFLTHFGKTNVQNATDVATSNRELLRKYHLALIANYGIFFLPTKMGALSYGHEESDVEELLEATEKITVESKLFKQQHS
jgi:glutamate-1-semialdehyde aminotransferase